MFIVGSSVWKWIWSSIRIVDMINISMLLRLRADCDLGQLVIVMCYCISSWDRIVECWWLCSCLRFMAADSSLLCLSQRWVGIVQRFFPSEFGSDPDRTRVSHLDHEFYSRKSEMRRLIEAEGIPYTYVCCNFYTSYLLPSLVQPGLQAPPRDKVTIFGDGNVRGLVFIIVLARMN